jgi:hypothetical protein
VCVCVCVWCTQMGRTGRGSSSLVDRAAQIERQQEAQFAYRANKLLQHFDAQENKRVSMGLRAAQIREPSVRARRPRRLSQRERPHVERGVSLGPAGVVGPWPHAAGRVG